jgi:hypothetical protein
MVFNVWKGAVCHLIVLEIDIGIGGYEGNCEAVKGRRYGDGGVYKSRREADMR